ncbi:MAG: LamG domain-containing protein [Planctomycetota bacterium]
MRLTKFLLALLIVGGAAPANAVITDSLIGLYDFENNFLDSSGSANANHGTPINNPAFTVGKVGTAMNLSGVRDYLSFDPATLTDFDFGNTDLGTDTDFSISMWIRQDDFASDPAVLSNKDWGDGNNTGINWAPKGNGIFDLNTKGSSGFRRDLDVLSTSAPLTVGDWNLVVMSVDRDGPTELYINGVNTGTIPSTSTGTFSSGLPWNIGQDGTGNYTVEFTGAVDELAVWHRALSSNDADLLWNGGAGIAIASQVVESRLKLVVDRGTGSMTIENNTGSDQDLIGYQITSSAGTLNQTNWNPVSGRLDASGDGSLDADGNWLMGTAADSVSNFVELALGTGTLAAGDTIELGAGTWVQFYQDTSDLDFRYADGVTDELIAGSVEFIGGANSPFAFEFGDLNFDGRLSSEDWTQLQSGFGQFLATLSEAQRYRQSDLNNDGAHTLADVLAFQIAYDDANGIGAFQAMTSAIPEPGALGLSLVVLTVLLGPTRRRSLYAYAALALAFPGSESLHAATFFAEDFDSLPLGANVDESVTGSNVWTATPPANWTIDNSGLPGGGVTEWRGWSFADPDWWAEAAVDQQRSEFTKGTGAIAVADPDEWADAAFDPGFYDTFLQTPSIAIGGAAANTVFLRFDSSWRPEDTQTATVTISFDGSPATELLRFSSVNGDADFKTDATNETILIPISNPGGASSVQFEFGMTDAGNDWWWAIDNIQVFSPLTLQVDAQTGQMQILGDSSAALKGYEIVSPSGSLAPAGWTAGNLDAQGVGADTPAATDFDSNNSVDAADLAIWNTAYAATNVGDSDLDGDSDGADFLRWQRQNGSSSAPGSTWSTFLATENRLIEAYLFDSSTFPSDTPIGQGYDTLKDSRDLQFSYTTADNELQIGSVQYVNITGQLATVPEPASIVLVLVILGTSASYDRVRRPAVRFPL